jgi:hypothetical protein
MSVKSACLVGCCMTLAVLSLLIGINGLMRDQDNEDDYDVTSAYHIPMNCTLKAIHVVTVEDKNEQCHVWRYRLHATSLIDPDEEVVKSAFGNFFPTRCGGTVFDEGDLDGLVRCWAHNDPEDPYLRVSPVSVRDRMYLHVALGCIIFAALITALFLVYNVVLWAGVCGNIGPFSRRSREERAERDLAAQMQPAGEQSTDPFELQSIEVADKNWLKDMMINNAYAQAVIRAFGGDDVSPSKPHHEGSQTTPAVVEKTELHASRVETVSSEAPCTDMGDVSVEVVSHDALIADIEPPRNEGDAAELVLARAAECCVCWDEMCEEAIVFPCFHMACLSCVDRMLITALRRDRTLACPLCRHATQPGELRRLHLRVDPSDPYAAEAQTSAAHGSPGSPIIVAHAASNDRPYGSETPRATSRSGSHRG